MPNLRIYITLIVLTIIQSAFAQITIETSNSTSRYEVGAAIEFDVTSATSGVANYIIKYDKFADPLETGTIDVIANTPTTITYAHPEASHVLCVVSMDNQSAVAGAAIGFDNIDPLEPIPNDFKQFWDDQIALLENVPIDPVLEPFSSTDFSDTYKISLGHIDNRRMYGYVTIPKSTGPFPAVLTMPSYGDAISSVLPDNSFAEYSNAISISISIHNAEVETMDANAYTPDNFDNRDENYYRYALLGGVRAIDYVYSRDDFDQTNVAVYGVSQGGGLSILMAGIDDRIDICMNSIPILCENLGLKYNKATGFPNYIEKSRNEVATAAHEAATYNAVKYYDAVHAANQFDGPVLMNVSYLDEVTPSGTMFAAYNQFKGNNKILIHSTNLGHNNPEEFWLDRFAVLRRFWPQATANHPWPWVASTTGHFVEAGPDQTVGISGQALLAGTIEKDGTDNTIWPVKWTKVDGPGSVNFSNQNNRNTTASFSATGTYLLKLSTQDDNSFAHKEIFYTTEDYIQVTVDNSNNEQPVVLSQTISFDPIADQLTTDNPFAIAAIASSNLEVSFSVLSGPATISGNQIILSGQPGIVSIQASQAGDALYDPAPSVTQTFEVIEVVEIVEPEDPTPPVGGCVIENVALNKISTQSGTQVNASADRANDGNTDGNFWGTNSVTFTDWIPNSWWEVDLGSVYQIEDINIWNRTDCCTTTLGEYHILISETPFASTDLNATINQAGVSDFFVSSVAGTPSTESVNTAGQFVRIQLEGAAALALAEVEIMGCMGDDDGDNNDEQAGCTLIGQPCNDSNVCTTNDSYDSNCDCVGTYADTDNDGVCDANDICPGGDDNIDNDNDGTPDFCDNTNCIVGAICNDNDPCTSFDVYDNNCGCAGIYQDTDNDGVCDAQDFDAPTPEESSVQICATPLSPSGMQFEWVADNSAQQYYVHKKTLEATSWGNPIATLPGNATSYVDNNVNIGEAYEYAFFKEPFVIASETVCVPSNSNVQFNISDEHGIGLCCSFGEGYYEILSCGNMVGYGDDFGFSDVQSFTVCDNGNACEEVIINIKPTMFPDATSWTLTDTQTGSVLASGGINRPVAVRPEYGYIYAGNEVAAIEERGTVLLLIDDSYMSALETEIDQLKEDFILDGWKVQTTFIDSNDTPVNVKTQIQSVYNSTSDLTALFLLGNIPVPYSGDIYPDTHSDHRGAWPADSYYGDMDGVWTDNTVNRTTAFFTRNHNVPGDGKFDQSILPSAIELQVGRVDLSRLNLFSDSEIELTRNYLNKNHAFKTGQVNTVRRGLIDDNFQHQFAAPASNGFRNFSTMFGWDNIDEVDYRTTLQNQSYLWSYGCGSGSNVSVNGVTSTANFANDNLQTVFTMLFGSQFGDWDHENNVLRAALASGQTLTNVWAGNPNWFFHHMPLGHNIGFSTIKTQNADNGVYLPSKQNIHPALMGDPTLRMHIVQPPTALTLNNVNGANNIQWSAPANESVVGYNIYRAGDIDNEFVKINNNLVTATSFTDFAPLDETNIYIVKTIKLESSCSGTYFNSSLGVLGSIATNPSICTINSPCDDMDPCTSNDQYDAACNCIGTFEDFDNDGICDLEDCEPLNPDLPGIPNSTCDDFDASTTDDIIQSDGCTCAGTPSTEECNIVVTSNAGSITISGLVGNDINTKVFTTSFDEVWGCNPWFGAPCNGTEIISGLNVGDTYYVSTQSSICNFFQGIVVEGGIACPDADNDSVCDAEDVCPGGDDLVDSDGDGTPDFCDTANCVVGQACNDLDDCTTNDAMDANCNCVGVFQDTDNDSICDSEDVCPGGDDLVDSDGDGTPDFCDTANCVVGQACNDLDDCTSNDVLDANCNCVGVFQDTDNDSICDSEDICPGGNDLVDSDGDGTPDFCDTANCVVGQACNDLDDCTSNDVMDANCNCVGLYQDTDNDSICDSEDVCPGGDDQVDSDGDGTPDFCDTANCVVGQACNDLDACTSNDVLDANCNCVGVFQDTDNDSICDSEDICPGGDDLVDSDGDGTPDFCDITNCVVGQACDDLDSNTTNDTFDNSCNCVGTPNTIDEYCASSGQTTTYEYIDRVILANINNTSGSNNGYANFTSIAADVNKGGNYTLQLTPGFTSSIYFVSWRVWIDYNQDGDFLDAGEQVYQRRSRFSVQTTITIPTNALTGSTRVRVSMNPAGYSEPCEIFSYGEVEDYTINIAPPFSPFVQPIIETEQTASLDFLLNPNPVDDYMIIELDQKVTELNEVNFQIFNAQGLLKQRGVFDHSLEESKFTINTTGLDRGYYILIVQKGDQIKSTPFIKMNR